MRDDDTVKVLDFGLAKARDAGADTNPDLMNSPTITSPATQMGMILGTAAYVSGDDGRWQISTQGGSAPVWRSDGRELYFMTPQKHLMAVHVDAGEAFRQSAPRELFGALFNGGSSEDRFYAPMPDGQSFVVDILKERTASFLTLVTNWTDRSK